MWSSPVFKLLRCAGFYPITYNPDSKLFTPSYYLCIINLIIFVLLSLDTLSVYPHFEGKAFFNIINQLCSYAFFVSLSVITISPICYQKKLCLIFNSITKIDNHFKKIGVVIDNKKPGNYTLIVFGISVGLTGIGASLEYFFPMWSQQGRLYFLYQLAALVFLIFLANFSYLTYHLKIRFEILNLELEQMIEESDEAKLFEVGTN